MNFIMQMVSENYDNELTLSKRFSFEALCATSSRIKDNLIEEYMQYYLITKSIKRVILKLTLRH